MSRKVSGSLRILNVDTQFCMLCLYPHTSLTLISGPHTTGLHLPVISRIWVIASINSSPPTCFASALTTASLPCWDPAAAPGLHILDLSPLTPGLLCPRPAWNHMTLLTPKCPSPYPLRLDPVFPNRWSRTERHKFILTHAEARFLTQEPGTVAQSLQMLSNLAFGTKRA